MKKNVTITQKSLRIIAQNMICTPSIHQGIQLKYWVEILNKPTACAAVHPNEFIDSDQ